MVCSSWERAFPGGSVVKNPPANAGDMGSIPGLGISPGGGNGNPHQYSCLGNPIERGVWQATVYGLQELDGHDLATKPATTMLGGDGKL